MKSGIPPVRGALHKALSEGCRMWAPVVPPIGKLTQAGHREGMGIDALRAIEPVIEPVSHGELPAAISGFDSQILFPTHQSEEQRGKEQDDENKEQDLGNPDGAGGDAGKTK